MATLALSFKDHPLSIHHLDDRPTTIGRDADCRICIDSLAVAPLHAELIPSDGDYLLLALDPDYPVRLNGEQADQASLSHGDLIQIGKHTLRFSADNLGLNPAADGDADVDTYQSADIDAQAPEDEVDVQEDSRTGSLPAYVQFQRGRHIGEIIVIRHAVTKLKYAGTEGIVITRERGSYRLVRQRTQADIFVLVGGTPLGKETSEMELHDGDLIEINEVCLRFFNAQTDGLEKPAKAPL